MSTAKLLVSVILACFLPCGADLSCYSCSDIPVSAGLITKNVNCKNPAKQTCGVSTITVNPQDRCITLKLKVKIPSIGVVDKEMKNCSDVFYCNEKTTCGFANSTGMISHCQVSCCFNNLCNNGETSTVRPRPITSQRLLSTTKSPDSNSTTHPPKTGEAALTEMPIALVYLSVLCIIAII